MNFKTREFSIFALIFLIGLLGCDDYLALDPEQSLDPETATDENGIEFALLGAYNELQDIIDNEIIYAELTSDLADHTGSFPSWLQVDGFVQDINNAESNTLWNGYYDLVLSANFVIASATSDSLQIAQALGLRAYAYFNLSRWYGGVPLILDPTRGPDGLNDISRSTLEQTWARVREDLTQAESIFVDLSNKQSSSTAIKNGGTPNSVTVTLDVILSLKARLELRAGNYEEAQRAATDVINSSAQYSLAPSYILLYGTVQTDPQGTTSEPIWQIPFDDQDNNGLSFFSRPNGNGGRFEYGPSEDLLALFNDNRIGNTSNDTTLASERENANIRILTGPGEDERLGKYFRTDGDDDVILIRLADLYLIRAEAAAKADFVANGVAALNDLNRIRNRSGLVDVNLADAPDLATFMKELLDERAREFTQEGSRYHDLTRQGFATVVAEDANAAAANDPNRLLYPVPFGEVEASGIRQNPGY
ncbi:MAG: RagB/SusD family nutrient uptake outer membrane protein [Bacteroidota bacterium]